MSGPTTWAKIALMAITICFIAMNNPVLAEHEKDAAREYAVLDQHNNSTISQGEIIGAGRAFICPTNCEERGGLCYCLTPSQTVPVYPPPNPYTCPAGCHKQNGFCWCLSPASVVNTGGIPQYVCPVGCNLQYQSCLCRTQPEYPPPQTPVYPPPQIPVYPPPQIPVYPPQYVCPPGCREQGGLCYCTSPAQLTQGPSGPTYACQPGCTLQYRSCLCFEQPEIEGPSTPAYPPPQIPVYPPPQIPVYPPPQIPVYPPPQIPVYPPPQLPVHPPQYVCPPGCRQQGGLCYCTSPAQLSQSPSGPTYACQPGCTLQYRSCLCFEQPEIEGPSTPDPVPPPESYICKEGCTEVNGLCFCTEVPTKIPETDPPEYKCRKGCVLQEQTQTCTCYYDPETSPEQPEGPDYPDEPVTRPPRTKRPKTKRPKTKRSKRPKPPKQHDCCTCEPGKELEYVSSSYNWFGAEQECRALSMRLVQIKCEEEEIKLEQLLREKGASRVFTDGVLMNYYGWTWEFPQKPFTYTKWKDGRSPSRTNEPLAHFTDYETESCMMVVRAGGDNYEWINDKCARTYPFVCERTNCNKSC